MPIKITNKQTASEKANDMKLLVTQTDVGEDSADVRQMTPETAFGGMILRNGIAVPYSAEKGGFDITVPENTANETTAGLMSADDYELLQELAEVAIREHNVVIVDSLPSASAALSDKLFIKRDLSSFTATAHICMLTGPASGYMWFKVGAYNNASASGSGLMSSYDYRLLHDVADAVEQSSGLVTRYGVRFEGGANSGATVKRLYNAAGLAARVGTDTQTATNDFDNVYPWSHIRRACGYWGDDGNFVVNAYKGEAGYTTDGSNGEVWVEIPVFYFRHEYDGDAEQIEISASRISGYMPSPIHVDDDGVVHESAYIAAYNMALVDNMPTSRSGVFSKVHSLNSAMADARKAGKDFTCSTSAERYTMSLLMFVEFATRNMQSVMKGASSMPYISGDTATASGIATNQFTTTEAIAAKFVVGQTVGIGTTLGGTQIANNRVITDISGGVITFDGAPVDIAVGNVIWTSAWKCGACDGVLSSSGSPSSNSSGKYPCMYRGIENPYGNAFDQISDVLFKREGAGTIEEPYTYDVYFLPDARKYANGKITDDYVKLNYNLPSADGYVKKLGIDARYPFVRLPVSVGATTLTYYSDNYYYPRYTVCGGRVGGSGAAGAFAGPSYVACNYEPSFASVASRARLSKHRKSDAPDAAAAATSAASEASRAALSATESAQEAASAASGAMNVNIAAEQTATGATITVTDRTGTPTSVHIDTLSAVNTWADIRNAVRLGLGPTLFPPGYEFTTHDEDTRNDIVWAVRAHDHHTPANSRLTHSMTLEAKYVYSYANGLQKGIQFDAAEALYFAEQGLAAGTYNFTWSFATGSMENGTYQFTLNHALPVNGQIVFNAGSSAMPITDFTIATYGSVGGTEAVESNIAVTQGTGGTALGTISLQGSINENLNCAQRILWGSGNYAQSAMRQWLNSSAAALGVWAPTNRFDRPAAWAASYNGFMYGLDADFLAVVERAVIPCRTNSVFEVESLDGTKFTVNQVYELRDKFFLLSRPEIYGSWDSTSCKDGELLEYYEGLTNAECIKRDASGAERIARLRGPHPGITSYGHVVDITGVLTGRHSHLGLGVAPACIIA